NACSRKDLVDIFPNPFVRESFLEKTGSDTQYVNIGAEPGEWQTCVKMDFGFGLIQPVYTAHLELLIPAWRKHLATNNALREEAFDIHNLGVADDHIVYNDIVA